MHFNSRLPVTVRLFGIPFTKRKRPQVETHGLYCEYMLSTVTHTAVGKPAALRAAAVIARAMHADVEDMIISMRYSNNTGYYTSQ